jgi:hypothetical protein
MTDLERYSGGMELPSDPLALALYAAFTTQLEVAELGKRVGALEGQRNIAAETRDWPTLRGFVIRYDVQPLIDRSDQTLSLLGAKIAAWHKSQHLHYRKGSAYHDVHGSVNRYDAENLHLYFTSAGYHLDEDTYRADRDAGQ